MKHKLIGVVSFFILVVLLIGGIFQRQFLKDSYIVRTTELQPQATSLLDTLNLTDDASFIFKASRPEAQPAQQFNNSCRNVAREHSIVLGCYTRQSIYIYDVKDARLNGVKEVTAAHELLHAVYERMSVRDKKELDAQLLSTAETIGNQRFKDTLAEYKRTEPDQIANELHSILGTEIDVLPSKLEAHYQKYFKNRSEIVAFSKQYESTFTELDGQIKQYDQQLAQLREQKDTLETSLSSRQQLIEADKASLERLRATGDTAAYNQAVPAYNLEINSYNIDIASLKQIVADYNNLVEKRNTLATTQNDLVKQLDSNYAPL